MELINVPNEIDGRYSIPSWDNESRRLLEAQGFVIAEGTLETYVMRRDFADGYLKTW